MPTNKHLLEVSSKTWAWHEASSVNLSQDFLRDLHDLSVSKKHSDNGSITLFERSLGVIALQTGSSLWSAFVWSVL